MINILNKRIDHICTAVIFEMCQQLHPR